MFTKAVAEEFLLDGSRQQDVQSAARLAKALGYLPLALAHARAYCPSSGCSFDDYRSRLAALIMKAPANAPYPQSVFATFNLALQQATVTTPEAEMLITLLAFLAPERVPRSLLAAELGDGCDDGISALANASLIDLEHDDVGALTVSCHRLVQEVARARLGDNKEQLIGHYLEMLNNAWPGGNQGSDPQFWSICRSLLTHAKALLSHAKQDQGYADKIALLMAFLATYLGSQGKYQEAEPVHRLAYEIFLSTLGDQHPTTKMVYQNWLSVKSKT